MELAERTRRIDSSGIRKVFALAADMKDPVNLSIGQPHFDVPDSVKEAAIHAIRDGRNSYTLTAGIPELRQRLLERYRQRGVEAEDVIITSGVSGGIARDRSTTAQRSRQGSKTAAGRKRSPRERADLDGENGVVAWVDTASPPTLPHQRARPT